MDGWMDGCQLMSYDFWTTTHYHIISSHHISYCRPSIVSHLISSHSLHYPSSILLLLYHAVRMCLCSQCPSVRVASRRKTSWSDAGPSWWLPWRQVVFITMTMMMMMMMIVVYSDDDDKFNSYYGWTHCISIHHSIHLSSSYLYRNDLRPLSGQCDCRACRLQD